MQRWLGQLSKGPLRRNSQDGAGPSKDSDKLEGETVEKSRPYRMKIDLNTVSPDPSAWPSLDLADQVYNGMSDDLRGAVKFTLRKLRTAKDAVERSIDKRAGWAQVKPAFEQNSSIEEVDGDKEEKRESFTVYSEMLKSAGVYLSKSRAVKQVDRKIATRAREISKDAQTWFDRIVSAGDPETKEPTVPLCDFHQVLRFLRDQAADEDRFAEQDPDSDRFIRVFLDVVVISIPDGLEEVLLRVRHVRLEIWTSFDPVGRLTGGFIAKTEFLRYKARTGLIAAAVRRANEQDDEARRLKAQDDELRRLRAQDDALRRSKVPEVSTNSQARNPITQLGLVEQAPLSY